MKTLFCITVIIFFLSCHNRDSSQQILARLNTADTFLYDFPKVNAELDSLRCIRKRFLESWLGLESLEKGFDSIQIRIQYGGSMIGNRLVILVNKNNKWNAHISKLGNRQNLDYTGEVVKNNREEFIPTRETEIKTPKSGWNSFINELFNLKILSIEDQSRIEGYKYGVVNDGCFVIIEIATKNVYRWYEMDEPDYFYYHLWQAKNLSRILKLVDDEFQLEPLWTYVPDKDAYKISNTTNTNRATIREVEFQDIKPDSAKRNGKK
ncbi:MAG TPA: hypothetical protein VHD35_08975 [Chitinophagaceae bacterium]|nr:hypothetical protein [Chitinophagaceae bacterium]